MKDKKYTKEYLEKLEKRIEKMKNEKDKKYNNSL